MADVLEKIKLMAEPFLEGTDMFIVGIKNKPTNNIKLYLDADSGFSIDKSASINRRLRKLIEEQELFPDGDFSLEVSSPGIDEPLVFERQYKKNVGRKVEVTLGEGVVKEGVLKSVTDNDLTLEIKVSKKETAEEEFALSDVEKIVVQISL